MKLHICMKVLILIFMFRCCVHAAEDCYAISEKDVINIAIKELKKQDKKYFDGKYKFVIVKDSCVWIVKFERLDDLTTSRDGAIVIRQNGTVKNYFGGM